MLYEFKPNMMHRIVSLHLERDRETNGTKISRIFSFNVKVSIDGSLESFSFIETNRDLMQVAAGIFGESYEFGQKNWIYPKFMELEDGSDPPKDLWIALNEAQQMVSHGVIQSHGPWEMVTQVIANPNVVALEGDSTIVVLTDPPEVTFE